jgi:ankyrin repeat protein
MRTSTPVWRFAAIVLCAAFGAVAGCDRKPGAKVAALHSAIQRGDDGEVADLIAEGVSPNASLEGGPIPMTTAIDSGARGSAIKYLLDAGADPNLPCPVDQCAPLSRAVAKPHPIAVRLLIDAGAHARPTGSHGYTPLMSARAQFIPTLLAMGADVNARTDRGLTALHMAATRGDPEAVGLLIAAGADVNALDGERRYPLHRVNNNVEVVKLLLAHGARVAVDGDRGAAALVQGTKYGTAASIRLLIAHGADPNARDAEGRVPLMYVNPRFRIDVGIALLQLGADANATDARGASVLIYERASDPLDQQWIDELKARGAKVRRPDR